MEWTVLIREAAQVITIVALCLAMANAQNRISRIESKPESVPSGLDLLSKIIGKQKPPSSLDDEGHDLTD